MNISSLQKLEQESLNRNIPILGKEKGTWLVDKIKEVKPKKILELGTANGYSGIILASEGAELTTIESDKKMAEEAMRNFAQFKIKAQVIIGDGVKLVKELKDSYDLIFIDFSKRNYLKVLENCLRLVKEGGLIIADNVGMAKCRNFKEKVLNHPQLKTEIIKIKDGLSCSEKVK